MFRSLLITMLLLIGVVCKMVAQGSIVTNNDYTTVELVTDIFATEECNSISNIEPIGNSGGIGFFENASGIIGLDRGIIISTGNTASAHGPNVATNTSGDFLDVTGDIDLNGLASNSVFDAVGISFDFTPLDSFVSFRYVFASEEYCEFVGSDYNDVFGFFVSGPGINGGFSGNAENVALIPGSNAFVAINSVNHLNNSAYYVRNELQADFADCNLGSGALPHLDNFEYDGFTTILTATLKLQPCQTYHIRLVVGDVADRYYDSAVFLEAGSFNTGGQVELTAFGGEAGEDSVYEGCNDGFFRVQRSDGDSNDFPLSITYQLGDNTTAESGVDFEPLAGQVTIPAGQDFIDIPLNTLTDELAEGAEEVQIVLDIPCACYTDSTSLFIVEAPVLELVADDIYFCPTNLASLEVYPTGGIFPYEYEWSNGGIDNPQEAPAANGETFYVTVTDACQHTITDTIMTWQVEPPSAFLQGSFDLCSGDTTWYAVELVGTPPFSLYYELDGIVQPPQVINILGEVPFTLGGEYVFLQVEDAACVGTADGSISVNEMSIDAAIETMSVSCFGFDDGSIEVQLSGDNPPFEFEWAQNLPDELFVENLFAGEYELHAVDSLSCENSWLIIVEEPLSISAPEIDCQNIFEGNLEFSAAGGTEPYQYHLGDENWQGPNLFQQLNPGQQYLIEVRDAAGCTTSFEWIAPVTLDGGMATLPAMQTIGLGTELELQANWILPPALVAQWEWSPADQLDCSDCEMPIFQGLLTQTIQLTIEDIFGCIDSLKTLIEVKDQVDFFAPNVFSPNGDEVNDFWTIYANPLQVQSIAKMMIFDRWGGLLFQADDLPLDSERFGWDGYSRGQLLEQGVYVYMVELLLVNGNRQVVSGDVLLLRN